MARTQRQGPRSRWELAVFAAGDFAFNLYWQSMMLYLLFYYTEAVRLPMATAALCYALVSVWDGAVSLAVGVFADRLGGERNHRLVLIGGAVPLGLSFVLAYVPPPFVGAGALAWIVAGQVALRTFYALVNIPYLAMSARISLDSGERALVAGGRMLAGTLAAVLVALGTIPLGEWLTGSRGPPAYAGAALIFAVIGSAILVGVGLAYREAAIPPAREEVPLHRALLLAWRNRAFATLGAAMAAMIVAVTMLDKSVLYYFKYGLGDQAGGQLALGAMMAVSGLAIPAWVMVSRRIGIRALWFVAIALCVMDLGLFVVAQLRSPLSVQAFLILMQVAVVGLNFALWAMLPDTVEYGQRRTGARIEAVLYGYSALLQRLAIGGGTLVMGLTLGNDPLDRGQVAEAAFRLTIALLPLGFLALSAGVMLLNPLRRGSHAAILRELRGSPGEQDEAPAHPLGLG